MVITTLTVAVTVAVLRLHHADPSDPPPTWLRVLTYTILVRITCLKAPSVLNNNSFDGSFQNKNKSKLGCRPKYANKMEPIDPMPTPVQSDEGPHAPERSEQRNSRSIESNMDLHVEYRFIALVVDAFFAGFFFLLFAIGTPIILYVYPVFFVPT